MLAQVGFKRYYVNRPQQVVDGIRGQDGTNGVNAINNVFLKHSTCAVITSHVVMRCYYLRIVHVHLTMIHWAGAPCPLSGSAPSLYHCSELCTFARALCKLSGLSAYYAMLLTSAKQAGRSEVVISFAVSRVRPSLKRLPCDKTWWRLLA